MELNREEIVKALECCATSQNLCEECPIDRAKKDDCICGQFLAQNALALITSQEQRIKELTEENERLRVENDKYEAENHAEFNKWLKLEETTKRRHAELFKEAKIAVKEDTVRKMQNELKKTFSALCKGEMVDLFRIIDQIAKEMLEESK